MKKVYFVSLIFIFYVTSLFAQGQKLVELDCSTVSTANVSVGDTIQLHAGACVPDPAGGAWQYEYQGWGTIGILGECDQIAYQDGMDPTHVYNTEGVYTVAFVPFSFFPDCGLCCTIEITVGPAVSAPACSANPIPSDGEINVNINQDLSWDAVATATSYDVYFGTPTAVLVGNQTGTSYEPGVLDNNTTYEFYVIPKNAGGDATGCGTWTFTTESLQEFSCGNGGQVAVGEEFQLHAGGCAGSTQTVWNYDYPGYGTIGIDECDFIASQDGPDPTYTYNTAGIYDIALAPLGMGPPVCTTPCCEICIRVGEPASIVCAVYSAPANAATDVDINQDISWNSVAGATSYDVYFGQSGSMSLVTTTETTSYDPGTLAVGTTYEWKVIAKNCWESATSCETWTFTTYAPNYPTITNQPTNQNICSSTDAVAFTVSVDNATSYQWQVYVSSWADIINGGVYSGATTNSLSISDVTGLVGNQYRCVASNADGDVTTDVVLIIEDTLAPLITSTHNNQQINADENCEALLDDYTGDVTATDNCSFSVSQLPVAGTTISGATNTVTLRVEDEMGNFDEITFNVEVVDNTIPVPDVETLNDITEDCEVGGLTAPTATDNCSGSITGTYDVTLPISETTTITWTYEDGNGNIATQTQDIIINDVTIPVPDIASLSNITEECEVTNLTAPTATDNCSGSITGTYDVTLPISETTTITWTYEDSNGNIATQTQNIIIEDISNPVPDVTNLTTLTASCSILVTEIPTATDNCAGNITAITSDSLSYEDAGTYTINWVYEDGNENIITQEQTVIVEDFDPIAETQDITVTLDEDNYAAITPEDIDDNSSDDCGIEEMTLDISEFGIDDIGENTVVLVVTDFAQNTASKSAIVTVNPFPAELKLEIPNFISPDNDGKNDFWVIKNVELLQDFQLIIVNKIGEIVYQSDSYDNSWGGTFNGEILPEATYYYVFKKEKEVYSGFITLVE